LLNADEVQKSRQRSQGMRTQEQPLFYTEPEENGCLPAFVVLLQKNYFNEAETKVSALA